MSAASAASGPTAPCARGQPVFQNGGSDAIIVRVHNGAATGNATAPLPGGASVVLDAASPGTLAANLRILVDGDIDPDVVADNPPATAGRSSTCG